MSGVSGIGGFTSGHSVLEYLDSPYVYLASQNPVNGFLNVYRIEQENHAATKGTLTPEKAKSISKRLYQLKNDPLDGVPPLFPMNEDESPF